MSYNIVIGGVVRHVAYCKVPGQVSTNRRDWQLTGITGGSSIGSVDTLATMDAGLQSFLTPLLCTDASYYGSQLYYQTPTPPRPRPEPLVSTSPGTAGNDLLPSQACGLISLYSNDLGKSGQGRFYVPFATVVDCGADGTPIAGYVTRLQLLRDFLTTAQVIVSGGVTATFTPVLYVPGGPTPKVITYGIARDAWATQRRRGAFGRTNTNPF